MLLERFRYLWPCGIWVNAIRSDVQERVSFDRVLFRNFDWDRYGYRGMMAAASCIALEYK
jgi:hypothetical protein